MSYALRSPVSETLLSPLRKEKNHADKLRLQRHLNYFEKVDKDKNLQTETIETGLLVVSTWRRNIHCGTYYLDAWQSIFEQAKIVGLYAALKDAPYSENELLSIVKQSVFRCVIFMPNREMSKMVE